MTIDGATLRIVIRAIIWIILELKPPDALAELSFKLIVKSAATDVSQ